MVNIKHFFHIQLKFIVRYEIWKNNQCQEISLSKQCLWLTQLTQWGSLPRPSTGKWRRYGYGSLDSASGVTPSNLLFWTADMTG